MFYCPAGFYGKQEDRPAVQDWKVLYKRAPNATVQPYVIYRPADPTDRAIEARRQGRLQLLKELANVSFRELRHLSFVALKYPPQSKVLARLRGQHPDALQAILNQFQDNSVRTSWSCPDSPLLIS